MLQIGPTGTEKIDIVIRCGESEVTCFTFTLLHYNTNCTNKLYAFILV